MRLVVDPHAQRVVEVQDEAGVSLGQATALDVLANVQRKRRKPEPPQESDVVNISPGKGPRTGPNLVELAKERYYGSAQADMAQGGLNSSTANSQTNTTDQDSYSAQGA